MRTSCSAGSTPSSSSAAGSGPARRCGELECSARADFAAQGTAEAAEVRRSLAMRYQGQNYEQEIAVPAGPIGDAELEEVIAHYHRLHEDFYGYRFEGIPVEL